MYLQLQWFVFEKHICFNTLFFQQVMGPHGAVPYQARPPDKQGGDSPRGGANARFKNRDGRGGAIPGPLGEKTKLAPVNQGKG